MSVGRHNTLARSAAAGHKPDNRKGFMCSRGTLAASDVQIKLMFSLTTSEEEEEKEEEES
jgi:hypothetical protein